MAIILSYTSAAVADGGQWIGCVSSHVHTSWLLMWDTQEAFATILTLWLEEDEDYNIMDLQKKRYTKPRRVWWVLSVCEMSVKDEDYMKNKYCTTARVMIFSTSGLSLRMGTTASRTGTVDKRTRILWWKTGRRRQERMQCALAVH
jgi:hypothetical protein